MTRRGWARTPPEPVPPSGPVGRAMAVPRPVWLFVGLSTVMSALAVRGIAQAGITTAAGFAFATFGAIPTAIAFLLPAALFLRHRRIWWTDRLLVVGTVLFGVVEFLQYVSPGMTAGFSAIIPAPTGLPFLVPLDVAFQVVVGILAAMAPIYTARGLLAARAYEDEPGSRRWWLLIGALTVVVAVTNVLNLVDLSLGIPPDAIVAYFWLTVLSVALSLLSVFGWAYLAGVALIGWRTGEGPLRGWRLAALGAGVVLLGLAVSGVIATVGVFTTPLPDELSIGILAAFALGYVLLLAAFLAGVPAGAEPVTTEA